MTCGEARRIIIAVVQRTANDADRLRLDEHLDRCPDCLAERGRWALMERLRDAPRPRVSVATRARILDGLQEVEAEPRRAPPRPLVRRPLVFVTAAVAAAAIVLLALRGPAIHRPDGGAAPVVESGRSDVDGGERLLAANAPGAVVIAGATIRYPASTALRLRPRERQVDLLAGEVEVEVVPGGPGRFRVVTPRFIVEVLGTRFFVRTDGVQTVHGVVRVLDPAERELAIVRAGESWRMPAEAPRAPSSVTPPAPPPPPIPPAPARPVAPAPSPAVRAPAHPSAPPTPPAPPPSAAELLDAARAALADGDAALARDRIRAVGAAHPSPRERAAADLLSANTLLVEGRYDDAVRAFREVAALHPDRPEAETALFAVAQLYSERKRASEARAALEEYARRFPNGHFAAEVREKLSRMAPAAPPAP